MKHLHVLKNVFAAIGVVAVASTGIALVLGAKPVEQQAVTFEYKVFNQAKTLQDALRQVQLDSQPSPTGVVDITTQVTTALDSQAKQVEATLNDLGANGWELAGFNEALFVVKRPVRE